MGLYERLTQIDLGPTETPIHVHQFMAALGEFERNKMSRAQIMTAFGLSVAEGVELDALTAKVRTPLESYSLNGRVTLTNVGTAYDTTLDSQSLPFIWLQVAGITRVDMEVRHRKVGTGSQDYQLFNDTDAIEAIGPSTITSGSFTDTNGAGDRTLTGRRDFASPLAPGVKRLRLRARSSVPADDPIFLNAALLVFRVDTITADVLHHILLMGQDRIAPLDTIAAVRTRLGV